MSSILVYVESEGDSIKKSSLEAVAYGAKIGDVAVFAAGDSLTQSTLEGLGKYGAKQVLHTSDNRLADGPIQAIASAVAQAFSQCGADILVMARSSTSDSLAPRVAIKVGAAAVSNVVSFPDTSEGFQVEKSIYTGKAHVKVNITNPKKVLTIRKSVVTLEEKDGTATVENFAPSVDEKDLAIRRTDVQRATGDVLLPEADVVVSAGRGLKGPENWGMIEELAKLLNAATACSKPVSDMEWRPHHEHVGQTGIKIAPNLYIAVGISGAIQHLAGVNSSKVIVVINKDSEAPFFKAADYGIVGDAFQVVPQLIEELKKAQG